MITAPTSPNHLTRGFLTLPPSIMFQESDQFFRTPNGTRNPCLHCGGYAKLFGERGRNCSTSNTPQPHVCGRDPQPRCELLTIKPVLAQLLYSTHALQLRIYPAGRGKRDH